MHYDVTEGTWQTPGGRTARFHYRRETNDWNTISATMTHDEYHVPSLSGVAVDVGGYLGSVGIGLALDNPDVRVWIIEPVPPNADLIERNIEANGVADRVTLIRGAVGKGGESVDVWYGYTGSVSLEHHAFVGNSTLAYDQPGEPPHDTATYKAIGLAKLIKTTGPIDWLKIDTEGAEWAFLTGPVSKVHTICGEWHPVRGKTLADMTALLTKTHEVTFDGPDAGPGGFRAVRRG